MRLRDLSAGPLGNLFVAVLVGGFSAYVSVQVLSTRVSALEEANRDQELRLRVVEVLEAQGTTREDAAKMQKAIIDAIEREYRKP